MDRIQHRAGTASGRDDWMLRGRRYSNARQSRVPVGGRAENATLQWRGVVHILLKAMAEEVQPIPDETDLLGR